MLPVSQSAFPRTSYSSCRACQATRTSIRAMLTFAECGALPENQGFNAYTVVMEQQHEDLTNQKNQIDNCGQQRLLVMSIFRPGPPFTSRTLAKGHVQENGSERWISVRADDSGEKSPRAPHQFLSCFETMVLPIGARPNAGRREKLCRPSSKIASLRLQTGSLRSSRQIRVGARVQIL